MTTNTALCLWNSTVNRGFFQARCTTALRRPCVDCICRDSERDRAALLAKPPLHVLRRWCLLLQNVQRDSNNERYFHSTVPERKCLHWLFALTKYRRHLSTIDLFSAPNTKLMSGRLFLPRRQEWILQFWCVCYKQTDALVIIITTDVHRRSCSSVRGRSATYRNSNLS